MDDESEALLPLLSFPTTTTITDAIDDLATHIVATWVVFGDAHDNGMESIVDLVIESLRYTVDKQLGVVVDEQFPDD